MWPRVVRISEERRTASAKSLVSAVRAVKNRFPKAVAFERGRFGKTIAEEMRHQQLVLGQGDDAVTNIARRKNSEFLAKLAAGTTVVGNGDDGCEFGNIYPRRVSFRFVRGSTYETLEPLKKGRESGASTDGHNPQRARCMRLSR